MKIKIINKIPVQNPPEVGSVHEVIKTEYEPPRHKRTKMYFIKYKGEEIGVFPHECERVYEEEQENE